MTATVKLFAYEGILTAHVLPGSGQYRTDSVGHLKLPYLARASLSCTTESPASSTAALTPKGVRLLQVQVQPGKTVGIEFDPGNGGRTASSASPSISGDQTFVIGEGWIVSVIEHEVS